VNASKEDQAKESKHVKIDTAGRGPSTAVIEEGDALNQDAGNMISSTGPVGLRDKFKLWEKNIFTEYLCRKYGRKTSQPESQMQIFPGIDHGFQNNEALG